MASNKEYVKVQKGTVIKKIPKKYASDYVAAGWNVIKSIFNTSNQFKKL